MEIIELPQTVKVLARVDGMDIVQIGLVDPLDINAYEIIAGLFTDKCIGLFRYQYECVEKWGMPSSESPVAVASFITFGVGKREKKWKKTIDEEIHDFCCRQRKSGVQYLIVYFWSNGGDERKIIVASAGGIGMKEIPRVETRTHHKDSL